jgi:hypothetical protein
MLEDITGVLVGDPWRVVPLDPEAPMPPLVPAIELSGPRPFFETGATRGRQLQWGRDYTGATFRSESWTYDCTRVCPDGYGGDCDDRLATSRCFRQISFPIGSRYIQGLLTGTPTGFASGNFNYRIESIGVNLVGTGIRDCSASTPGCFGSGNVSYSLLHSGPFAVVNARGETYYAPLFPGRIESARALTAERYITNPISSADAALLGPFERADFRGRPLGGTLMLRLWDEPTVDFDRVEDVQLVVRYRYWQHQR